jgi:hypothetical protein
MSAPFHIDTASQRRLIHEAESNRLRASRRMAVRLILIFGTISAVCSALTVHLLTR